MILHPLQRKIISSTARFKIIRAGRRSGKTFMNIEDILFTAMEKKGRQVFYIAPTQVQARAIIWESLKQRLGDLKDHVRYNEQRLEIEVPTQDGGTSHIFLAGWENKENFRGRSADLIVFDELDTMIGFMSGWETIFRPALTDRQGRATFIGTPKKENPNLRRLEKVAETNPDFVSFHYVTADNPHIALGEIEKARMELDSESFTQEYLAQYVTSGSTLFDYSALIDMFTNTVTLGEKFMTVDIAGQGKDFTKIGIWNGMQLDEIVTYQGITTENIILAIKEQAQKHRVPYSHIAVDAIGEGAGVATSSLLQGIIGYKGSHAPFQTDKSLTSEKKYTTAFKNLRTQCIYALRDYVNDRKIACRIGGEIKDRIIEELFTYQDTSKGDGKTYVTTKEEVKEMIGRSPDDSDLLQMRMYFEVRRTATVQDVMLDTQVQQQVQQFIKNRNSMSQDSAQ